MQTYHPLAGFSLTAVSEAPLVKQPSILATIVQHKQQEVQYLHQQFQCAGLQRQLALAPAIRPFLQALQHSPHWPSLIAEVKKASPSRGVLRTDFNPVKIAQAYEQGGASCISVLTDTAFFQGSFDYLQMIRQQVDCPLLCKDFILDPYQVYAARLMGADAILLIAAILPDDELQSLLTLVHQLGMEALIEVHTLTELDRVLALDTARLIGINNRNLETFNVDLDTTRQLIVARWQQLRSKSITIVSESGFHTAADLAVIAQAGARTVLVGEALVKQTDWVQAVSNLLQSEFKRLAKAEHL
jgi:indole-3-glycerol phosphate synthase